MKKIAIVGSREYKTTVHLLEFMLALDPKKHIVVSGGAKGVDSHAANLAKHFDIRVIEYLPDWDKYGKSAGPIRNKQIVDNCDELVAFWDTESKGTYSSMKLALDSNKLKAIYTHNGQAFYNE